MIPYEHRPLVAILVIYMALAVGVLGFAYCQDAQTFHEVQARADPTLAVQVPDRFDEPQRLETTVQDPANPEEPWVVTTTKWRRESVQAFIQRHREMVEAVREALR